MDNKEIVRDGNNQIAKKYLEKILSNLEEMSYLQEFISLIKKKGKVLDAGCGGGLPYTRYLSDYFEVIGIDISEVQIELAKKNVPKAQFFVKDMTELDFPDHSFDGILASYSIIYVPREEHSDLFANFYRMLKPNGIALFSLHSTDDSGSIEDDFIEANIFWRGFDKDTNIRMLTEVGFEIIWSKFDDSLGYHQFLYVIIKKS
ncbi:MAG: class I SAM-dependent methyltransferase [Candidatus Heimdallarchaeota archaeon]|nr:MAG: class I SAM-dependent methyltransferase [Candidatus Heimdallarchaeota archaeon]